MAKSYWLLKSEPDAFSFDDLIQSKNSTSSWDGVRNYQARNLMRDDFKKGDLCLFYHSRIAKPACVGIAEVVKESYPDHTALDPKCKYFDEKSAAKGESRWNMVDVKAKHWLKNPVTLESLRSIPELSDLPLLRKGMRLSVQPVSKEHFNFISKLAGGKKGVD